jgi:membrane-associated phospholipid phosphatase
MRATRIITAVLAGLVIAAILAGPAGAVPTDVVSGGSTSSNTPAPTPRTVIVTEPSGFDWGSAGIGAAAGLGACAIVLAAAGLRRRRGGPSPSTLAH